MSFIWKWGSRPAAAPKTAIAAARAALEGGRIDYTSALGIASLRGRIARHYRDVYRCNVMPSGSWSRRARPAGLSWRFWRCSSLAIASRSRCPAIRRTAISSPPLGCEPVLIETSSETRHALTGEVLLAAHRDKPLQGVLVASPANPTGTMMSREALTSLIAAADGAASGSYPTKSITGSTTPFPR